MKKSIVIVLIVIVTSSVWVCAEDAPRVFTDDDLQNYGSSDRYYRDRKEERDQYYQDKQETREEDKRERDISNSQKRIDIEERNKRREECKSEAKSKIFWCPATDKGGECKRQWTNAYRDCNFID